MSLAIGRSAPKAALYLRVSKAEQSAENQRPEVEGLASARGFEVVATFEEAESAAKYRPAFTAMMQDARRGRFNVIVTWSLDRFGRGFSCFDAYRDLARIGVKIVSVREPWTEAEGPALELLVAVMSWVSGFERTRLIERTKAGIERARRQGKRIGRPPASPVLLHAARDLVDAGVPVAEAARRKGVSRTTLRRFVAMQQHREYLSIRSRSVPVR